MRNILIALIVAGIISLVGCGGGNGNVGPPAREVTPRSITGVSAANLDRSQKVINQVAISLPLPNRGGVTQSSSHGISGITDDAVSTTFDGSNLTVTVNRQDGSSLRLDSATDTVPGSTLIGPSPIPGHSQRAWGLARTSDDSVSIGAVGVSSHDANPNDYLSLGLWMHVTGDVEMVTGMEIGAFVNGPEISSAADVPVLGSATYHGAASGLGVQRMGTEGVEYGVPEGTALIGGYDGSLELVADFEARHISGVIDEMYVTGVAVTPDGQEEAFEGANPTVIHLHPLAIDSNGTFRGENVTVTHPLYTIVASEGSWGGRFSTIDDAYGNPRLVAGTHGFSWTSSGGTEGAFVGTLVGTTE